MTSQAIKYSAIASPCGLCGPGGAVDSGSIGASFSVAPWTLCFGSKASEFDRHGCKQLFWALYVECKPANEVGVVGPRGFEPRADGLEALAQVGHRQSARVLTAPIP